MSRGPFCHHFIRGDIQNFDDVYNFGKGLDALTIEIEAVNEDALERLEQEGVKIYPKPSALRTIKNKILQKQFYKDQQIPYGPICHYPEQGRTAPADRLFACCSQDRPGRL